MIQNSCDIKALAKELIELASLTRLSGSENVLVYETSNISPHFETSIEIAVLLSLIGCNVYYVFAGHSLQTSVYYNKFTRSRRGLGKATLKELVCPTRYRLRRTFLKYKRRFGADVRVIEECSRQSGAAIGSIDGMDISSIRTMTYKGCTDYGESIAGSLCAITGEENRLVDGRLREEAEAFSSSYVGSYEIVASIEKDIRLSFHSAVVFNGRFPWVRGAVQRLKESRTRLFFHERGPSMHRYFLSDSEPHKRIAYQADCKRLWEEKKDSNSYEMIGRAYYENQRSGADQVWTSFSKEQVDGLAGRVLKSGRDSCPSGKVVVFFSSSENELLAIRDFWKTECPPSFEWKNQKQAFEKLARACQEVGHQLIVRVHPHMQKKPASVRGQWDNLYFLDEELRRSIMVVKSDSLVSSYELVDGADIVVSNGSTVGIEAVYWKKPSILIGHSYYDETGATLLKPYTYKQLVGYLRDFAKHRVDPDSAIPYGYFMKEHGISHCIYKPISLFKGYI